MSRHDQTTLSTDEEVVGEDLVTPDPWYSATQAVPAVRQEVELAAAPSQVPYAEVAQTADLAIVTALHGLVDRIETMSENTDRMGREQAEALARVASTPRLSDSEIEQAKAASEALSQVADRLAAAVERLAEKDTSVTVHVPEPLVTVVTHQPEVKQIVVERDAAGRIAGAVVENLEVAETEIVVDHAE